MKTILLSFVLALVAVAQVTTINGTDTVGNSRAVINTNFSNLQTQLNSVMTVCTDAGSTDTYACTAAPVVSAYTTGMRVRLYAATANTGAATVNLSTLGAKTIVKVGGGITTALADNDIRAGQYVDLVYDGTNFQMLSQLGNAAAGGSSLPTQTGNAGMVLSTNGTDAAWRVGSFNGSKRWSYAVYSGSGTAATAFSAVGVVPAITGTLSAIAATDTEPTLGNLASAATTDSRAELTGGQVYRTQRNTRAQFYVRVPSAGDYATTNVFLGMTNASGANITLATWSAGMQSYGFRARAGTETNWQCAHSANTSSVDTADSGVAVDYVGHVFETWYDWTNSTVMYYIDGTRVCSGIAQTNRPQTGYNQSAYVGTRTLEAVAKNIQIGWIKVESDK